jgi:hypothetical protein
MAGPLGTIPCRKEWRYHFAAHKVIALDAGHVCQNCPRPLSSGCNRGVSGRDAEDALRAMQRDIMVVIGELAQI